VDFCYFAKPFRHEKL